MTKEIIKEIEENSDLDRTDLEELAEICSNRIWQLDRANRIRELEDQIERLKLQKEKPKLIQQEEDEFDSYVNR